LQNSDDGITERYLVRLISLHALARQRPQPCFEVELAPSHLGDLVSALPGQHKKPHQGSERRTDLACGLPDQSQLVVDLLDRIVDSGRPIAANRTFAAVRKMFNWAVSRDILTASPCAGVKPPTPERARDRVLIVNCKSR
jgi:hypothetical protein